MKKTNLLFAIPRAFYSADFYREVAKSWCGRSFIYLLVFLVIFWIPLIGTISVRMTHFFDGIAQQMPTLQVAEGVVSAPKDEPYFIRDPQGQSVIAVIDTGGQYQGFQKSTAWVMVTKDAVYTKNDNGKSISKTMVKKSLALTLGPEQLVNKVHHAMIPFVVVAYLLGVLVSYGLLLMWGLLYGLFGMFISQTVKSMLTYGQSLGVALVAITPGMGLFLVLWMFNIMFHWEWVLILVIQLLYLVFAVKSAKKLK